MCCFPAADGATVAAKIASPKLLVLFPDDLLVSVLTPVAEIPDRVNANLIGDILSRRGPHLFVMLISTAVAIELHLLSDQFPEGIGIVHGDIPFRGDGKSLQVLRTHYGADPSPTGGAATTNDRGKAYKLLATRSDASSTSVPSMVLLQPILSGSCVFSPEISGIQYLALVSGKMDIDRFVGFALDDGHLITGKLQPSAEVGAGHPPSKPTG